MLSVMSSAADVDGPADDPVETSEADKTVNSAADDNSLILGVVYQGLLTRYNSLTTIRWQTSALGLAAQGFIVGAASQVQKAQLTSAIMLAIVILFIGLATIITGQRFEVIALADRYMLDAYEAHLLQGRNSDLRLHHALAGRARGAVMLRGAFLRKYQDELSKRGPYWVLNRLASLGPYHWWIYSQLVISIVGAAIPVLRYFGV